jgi:hypothetical protein
MYRTTKSIDKELYTVLKNLLINKTDFLENKELGIILHIINSAVLFKKCKRSRKLAQDIFSMFPGILEHQDPFIRGISNSVNFTVNNTSSITPYSYLQNETHPYCKMLVISHNLEGKIKEKTASLLLDIFPDEPSFVQHAILAKTPQILPHEPELLPKYSKTFLKFVQTSTNKEVKKSVIFYTAVLLYPRDKKGALAILEHAYLSDPDKEIRDYAKMLLEKIPVK